MGFEQDTYEVNEPDSFVTVCVNLTTPIERRVTVALFTVGTTAQGQRHIKLLSIKFRYAIQFHFYSTEGNDYIPVSENLTFDPQGSLQECLDISLVNDTVYEEDEMYSVFLVNNNPNVVIRPASATVTIIDEDGQCFRMHLSKKRQ